MKIGIELSMAKIDGKRHYRFAPYIETKNAHRDYAYIAAGIAIALFAFVALQITDVPDIQQTADMGAVWMR